MSAAASALTEPTTFRLTQGTSTKPATGSQTSPNKLLNAIAKASAACVGLPPQISTAAAAAMPEALPTSAWQPPVAPAIIALLAVTIPNALAQKRKAIIWSVVNPRFFCNANNTPGIVPEEPAVGVAQINPMAALTSFVANEFSIA